MTLLPAPVFDRNSRLISNLADLGIRSDAVSHSQFVRKLAGLFDLSDSIALSAVLRRHPRRTPGTATPAVQLRDDFLDLREQLLQLVVSGFDPATQDPSLRLPRPSAETLADTSSGFLPYQRHYALLQSELDFRILKFRHRARQALSTASDHLAQLAALDAALDKTLSAHSRKLLAAVPQLLLRRFQALAEQVNHPEQNTDEQPDTGSWLQPGGWLRTFCLDMQALLLAELDTRLQPLLGLVEAMGEELEHTL